MKHRTLQWYRKGNHVRQRHVARQDLVEELMLTEYLKLHRGHKHTTVFSKDQRGYRRRSERRFVIEQKQQELHS